MKNVSYQDLVDSFEEAMEFIDGLAEENDDLFLVSFSAYPVNEKISIGVSFSDIDPTAPRPGTILAVGQAMTTQGVLG